MKKILEHKISSIIVVLILGIFFGIFAVSTKKIIVEKADEITKESEVTDGKVLASVKLCDSDYLQNGCDAPEKYDERVLASAKKYNGETIGAKITYVNKKNEKVYVILERAGKYLNGGKTFFIQGEKIPVLRNLNAKIDENMYEVFKEYSSDETPFYIMMDDTMNVINFLAANGFSMLNYDPLAIFDSEEKAFEFYKNESSLNFEISQIFNKTISKKEALENEIKSRIFTGGIFVLLSIFALLIFKIVISNVDKKKNQLFRMFGATKKDIFNIYLFSGMILFIFAIFVAVIVFLVCLI